MAAAWRTFADLIAVRSTVSSQCWRLLLSSLQSASSTRSSQSLPSFPSAPWPSLISSFPFCMICPSLLKVCLQQTSHLSPHVLLLLTASQRSALLAASQRSSNLPACGMPYPSPLLLVSHPSSPTAAHFLQAFTLPTPAFAFVMFFCSLELPTPDIRGQLGPSCAQPSRYTRAHAYTHMHTHMRVHTHLHPPTHTHAHMRPPTPAHAPTHMHAPDAVRVAQQLRAKQVESAAASAAESVERERRARRVEAAKRKRERRRQKEQQAGKQGKTVRPEKMSIKLRMSCLGEWAPVEDPALPHPRLPSPALCITLK